MSRKRARTVRSLVLYAFLISLSAILIFPVLWLLLSSLRTPDELFSWPISFWPGEITLDNYRRVLFDSPIPRTAWNSVKITVISSLIITVLASLAAYGFSRFEFPGKRFLFIGLLAIRMFPLVVMILPLYLLWQRLGLFDSLLSIVTTYVAVFVSLAVWLLKGFFDAIAIELEEAAMIDGATRLQCLTRIVIPLARPGITAVFIFVFVFVWNEYMIVLTLTETEAVRPLSVGLVYFMGQFTQDWGATTAASALGMIPVIILFAAVQKNFIKGLSEGGMKG